MSLDDHSDKYISRLSEMKANLDASRKAEKHYKKKSLTALATAIQLVVKDQAVEFIRDLPSLLVYMRGLEDSLSIDETGTLINDLMIGQQKLAEGKPELGPVEDEPTNKGVHIYKNSEILKKIMGEEPIDEDEDE